MASEVVFNGSTTTQAGAAVGIVCNAHNTLAVIPAKAGIQNPVLFHTSLAPQPSNATLLTSDFDFCAIPDGTSGPRKRKQRTLFLQLLREHPP